MDPDRPARRVTSSGPPDRGSALSLLAGAVAGGVLVVALGTGPGSPLQPIADGLSRAWDGVSRVVDGPGGPGPR